MPILLAITYSRHSQPPPRYDWPPPLRPPCRFDESAASPHSRHFQPRWQARKAGKGRMAGIAPSSMIRHVTFCRHIRRRYSITLPTRPPASFHVHYHATTIYYAYAAYGPRAAMISNVTLSPFSRRRHTIYFTLPFVTPAHDTIITRGFATVRVAIDISCYAATP